MFACTKIHIYIFLNKERKENPVGCTGEVKDQKEIYEKGQEKVGRKPPCCSPGPTYYFETRNLHFLFF